jgi:hypothetical protein
MQNSGKIVSTIEALDSLPDSERAGDWMDRMK